MSMNYNDPEMIQYMIQPGDTLWDLADEYGTTEADIIAANPGIDPDNLPVGEMISVPDPPVFGSQFGFRRPFRFRRRFFRPPFRRRFFRPPFFRRRFFRPVVFVPVPVFFRGSSGDFGDFEDFEEFED